MSFLSGIIPILIVISFIVTIHELGHFWVAKAFKTKIDRFSVGFGPVLWSRTDRHGVEWCLSAVPLGGYVKFSGDESLSSMSPDKAMLDHAREVIVAREGQGAELAYFHFKPVWQRFLIVLAGPAANFILAIVLLTLTLVSLGDVVTKPVVGEVLPQSPAALAGLRPGDLITKVDNRKITGFEDISHLITLRADTDVRLDFIRDSKPMSVSVHSTHVLRPLGPNGQMFKSGVLGIRSAKGSTSIVHYGPIEALVEANHKTWLNLDITLTYIGRIFSGQEKANQITGIVGMTQGAGDVVQKTADLKLNPVDTALTLTVNFIMMTVVISIGVGFLNLLPIPVLDGGHLLFYTIEAVMQKPVSAAVQEIGYRIGLASLLGLMLFAFYNDLNNIGVFKFLGGLLS